MKMIVTAITTLALATIIFTATTTSSIAAALNCESYENRINRLQNLNARGGKAKQQESRKQQISRYEDELHNCSNIQKIKIATNSQKFNAKTDHQKLRSSKIQNPQTQQLIKTCNYWIDQNNKNPSWDNTNYRDTACRAADENEEAINSPSLQIAANVRKLKDCIKPNNLIDDEVNECIKGNKDASWKK